MDMPVKDSPGLCRCCFSEGCYKDLSTAYAWMGDTEIYADMLLECFDISITQHVDGPNGPNRLICEVCITRLRDASNFKKQVLNCEKKFIDMVAKGAFKASTSEFNVQVSVEKEPKLEPILEEDIETPNLDYLDVLDYDDDFDPKGEASTSHQSDDNEPLAKLTTRKRKLKPKKETATKAAKGKAPKVVKKEEKPKATKKGKSLLIEIVNGIVQGAPSKPESCDLTVQYRRSKYNLKLLKEIVGSERPSEPQSSRPTRPKNQSYTKRSDYGQGNRSIEQPIARDINENTITLMKYTSIVPFVWIRNRFQCFLCDKTFLVISELKSHMNATHSVLDALQPAHLSFSEIKFDISGLQCRVCFQHFEDFDTVVEHINTTHSAGFNVENRNYYMPFKIGEPQSPCLACNKIFNNFQVLLRHVRKQHVTGKHLCLTCGLSYVFAIQLEMHMKACHSTDYKCSVCERSFTYNGAKKIHEATEHGIAERKCRVCGTVFVTHYQLRKHELNVHDMGLRINCKHCPAKFISQTYLNAHVSSHHAEKVSCNICGKSLNSNQLERHMKNIHQRTVSYVCDICHQEFTAPQSLKRHRKKHFTNREYPKYD